MRKFLGSLFGLGLIPGAPGTYASVVALAVWYLAVRLGAPGWVWPLAATGVSLYCLLVGVPGGSTKPWRDPRWFVLDEVAGALVAAIAVPVRIPLVSALAALFFFRLFDILKPAPVSWCERLPGTMGVLTDDLAAGVLANLCTQIVLRVGFRFF